MEFRYCRGLDNLLHVVPLCSALGICCSGVFYIALPNSSSVGLGLQHRMASQIFNHLQDMLQSISEFEAQTIIELVLMRTL